MEQHFDIISHILSNNYFFRVYQVVKAFGLPSDIDSCFYNEFLSLERDTRIRIGEGKVQ